MKRSALIVGINDYEDAAHINRLDYAEQDASAMRYFLQRRGGFDVTPLIGAEATRRRISDAVHDLCGTLGPDDLFVFYFAGHGYEDDRGHLLLASDVRFRELQAGMAPDVVPVRGLEKMTASAGFSRLLILDACRSPVEKGRSGGVALNETATRDLQSVANASSGNPPLALLCSCSPEQRAHELTALKAGVFTEALVAVLEERLSQNAGFCLPGDLDALSLKTNALLRTHGIADGQDPWCTANRGMLALIAGDTPEPIKGTARTQNSPPPPEMIISHKKLCPFCGLRNDPDETFKCLACGRDYLCRSHFVEQELCCKKCAAEKLLEREAVAEAERKRVSAEAERRARNAERNRAAGTTASIDLGGGVNLDLVWIQPGDFVMGSPEDELGRYDDEGPQRRVTLSKGFWMGKYPVTQEQYEAVTGNNPSKFSGKSDSTRRPVVRVSWDDAKSFCEKLNSKKAAREDTCLPIGTFRLPSEAEWEYVCRSGTTSALYNGKELTSDEGSCPHLDEIAWYDENCAETQPVGGKQPNAWGLYDMLGNVYEWCQDWYGDYYPSGAATDPKGPPSGSGRVGRGGSWRFNSGFCRSAYRFSIAPSIRSVNLGFRLVCCSVP